MESLLKEKEKVTFEGPQDSTSRSWGSDVLAGAQHPETRRHTRVAPAQPPLYAPSLIYCHIRSLLGWLGQTPKSTVLDGCCGEKMPRQGTQTGQWWQG